MSVIRTYANWSVEGKRIRAHGTFPHGKIVSKDLHFCSIHFGAKNMRASGIQKGKRRAAPRLDVLVSPITALRAGVLAGIAFHRDDEFRFGLNPPHRINQVARILGAKLQANLAAHFARGEWRFVWRWAEVGESRFSHWLCIRVEICPHLRCVDREPLPREFLNRTFGNTETCFGDWRQPGREGLWTGGESRCAQQSETPAAAIL